MRRLALAALLALWPALGQAQFATIGPTPPVADNGDRLATTAWVNLFAAGSIPLQSGKIFIGSGGNLAVGQTPSGDCTLSLTGVVTCTQAAGNFQVIGNLTVGGSIIDGNGILFTNIVAPASPAAGTTRGYVDSTNKVFCSKNDAGTVACTVSSSVAVANQFMTGITAAGAITRGQPAFTDISGRATAAQIPQGVARSVKGVTGNATADVADIQGTANQVLVVNSAGTALAFGQVNLASASAVTGTLPIANGGTGATTGAVVNVKRQSFCASGCVTTVAAGGTSTYTPSTGLVQAIVECVGTGGGGGGVTGSAGAIVTAGGGGAGAYSRILLSAATIGASKTVTNGTAGTGGAAGNNNGTTGGDTSLGTLCVAKGGVGGNLSNTGANPVPVAGGAGASGTGDLIASGAPGMGGYVSSVLTTTAYLGSGGSSIFGGGGAAGSISGGAASAGGAATQYGSGGGGASAANVVATAAGGNGSAGGVWITEYVNQ